MVFEALQYDNLVEYLIIKEEFTDRYRNIVEEYNDKVIIVTANVYKSIASAVSPQGVMAVIKMIKPKKLDMTKNLIVLDHLQDPGNLGTIIRSGVASGHDQILLINSVDPYNEKTIRSATGTIFKANFYTYSMDEFLEIAKKSNLNIIVADMGGVDIFNANVVDEPYALVIGSEGQGVSDAILSLPHKTVAIPMVNGVESLNAGVSASIIMFNLWAKK